MAIQVRAMPVNGKIAVSGEGRSWMLLTPLDFIRLIVTREAMRIRARDNYNPN